MYLTTVQALIHLFRKTWNMYQCFKCEREWEAVNVTLRKANTMSYVQERVGGCYCATWESEDQLVMCKSEEEALNVKSVRYKCLMRESE